jgi:KaiC/GvpD/RAD55 family RecA-like ATPase
MPGAVSGENGSGKTYHVACVLVKGFELPTSQAMEILHDYNTRCYPPWTDHELQHKLDDATRAKGASGYLRNAKQERWSSIDVPEYKQPANGKPTNGSHKAERPGMSKPSRKQLSDVVAQSILHSAADKKTLVNLGIPDLNRAIGGGAEFGELITIAARPSHGKSALALQMISSLTAEGIECAFISEEMSALTVGKRVIQFVTNVPEPRWNVDIGKVEQDIATHFGRRAQCHVVEGCRTAERVVTEVRELAASGVKAVVVDYVQLLASSSRGRYETVTENSVALRQVCTETGVLMIVLAQMSRAIEGREMFIPKVSDLRESGQLEQDADVLLFLVWPWKLDQTKEKSEYAIYVMKNRNREIVTPLVNCVFDGARQRISGVAKEQDNLDWTDRIR